MPIRLTLHSTHIEERTERRIIIDAAMSRQLKILEVPDELLIDVTPESRELPERFRGLGLAGDRGREEWLENRRARERRPFHLERMQ